MTGVTSVCLHVAQRVPLLGRWTFVCSGQQHVENIVGFQWDAPGGRGG